MARKLYTEVGGASKQARKLYTEVGGVSHKVKKVYAEVNGLSKLLYSTDDLFSIGFRKYYYNTIALNSYCELSSWFCGYRDNGLPGMDIVCWNAANYNDGAPVTSIDIDFINPASLVGKTITLNYNVDFDVGDSYNMFWYEWIQNGSRYYGSLGGGQGGPSGIGKMIQSGMTRISLAMRTGNSGNNGEHVTLTSIMLDGVQVFP